jgi:hypothetical protein
MTRGFHARACAAAIRYSLSACLFVAAVLVAAGRVDAAPIVSAPVLTVGVGDAFVVSIAIEEATDLTGWQFDLIFDPSIVQATSVAEGPFLASFGTTLFVPGVIDNVTGRVDLTGGFYVDLPPNPSGDGVLALIGFTALQVGVSPLTLGNVFLNFSDSGFDVSNGQVTVTPRAVPEPGTLVLLLTGAVVGGRRCRRAIGPV